MTQLQTKRIVQGVSFSLDDPLIPRVKALVRERGFSRVCRQALTAWFEKEEDEGAVIAALRRIEAKLEAMGLPPLFQHGPTGTSLDNAALFEAMRDAEGTEKAASALDSY